jgi:hypothetical protein
MGFTNHDLILDIVWWSSTNNDNFLLGKASMDGRASHFKRKASAMIRRAGV